MRRILFGLGAVALAALTSGCGAYYERSYAYAPPAAVYSVTWTTDGKQLLSGSFDKSMKLWDAVSGNLVREFKPFDGISMPTFLPETA